MSRRRDAVRRAAVLAGLALVPFAQAASDAGDDGAPRAPFGALVDGGVSPDRAYRAHSGGTLYSHGDPTAEEQHLLELMNRARLDPAAEADRIFADYDNAYIRTQVDFYLANNPGEYTREENRAAFVSYPAKPPFAFDARLIAAARKHSELGRVNDDQSHQYPGEGTLRERVEAEGWTGQAIGESVFAYARSMLACHAAFAIDWGQAPLVGETRPFTGHRLSLMDYDGTRPFVTVGVGIVEDASDATQVGPRIVTIDFAVPSGADTTRYVTGVCYEDHNGNGAYDAGEGIAGAEISSPGSTYYTRSSASGGYALPVPGNAGTIAVNLVGDPNGPSAVLANQTAAAVVAGQNVKLDFTPPPDPPIPDAQTFTSAAAVPLADGAQTEAQIDVTEFDPENTTVGDVDVSLQLAHPDASELRIALVSPEGTQVVLLDHGAPLADLQGDFDTTLTPEGDLGAFLGEPYAGAWRLRVDDDSTSGPGRAIASWSVRIRPAWIRRLSALRTNLAAASFRAIDSANPAADQIRFVGKLDAGGIALDAAKPAHLRLLAGDGSELARYALDPLVLPGVRLKAAYGVGSTSKANVNLKITGLDLPSPLPTPLTVELSLGGAVARQTLPLTAKGAYASRTLPAAPYFRVDLVKSTQPAGNTDRKTLVKARVAGGPAAPTPAEVTGVLEVLVGDLHTKIPRSLLTVKGTRVIARNVGFLRKFTFDTRTGALQVQILGPHEPRGVDGRIPVWVRMGGFFGSAEVLPRVTGTTLVY